VSRSWDLNGTYSLELQLVDGQTQDFDGNPFPHLDLAHHGLEYAELVIEFRSRGHYQPASMYGGPDHLGWPEEGSDERTLLNAYLELGPGGGVSLPEAVQAAVFAALEKQIQTADLEGDR
jgi:hypothetical protein